MTQSTAGGNLAGGGSRGAVQTAAPRFVDAPFAPPPGADVPHKSSSPITIAFVVRAIRRWWKVITPIALVLAAIASAALYIQFEAVYSASSWLRIEAANPYVIFPEGSSKGFVNTQLQLMRSPLVLERVVAEPQIARFKDIQTRDEPVQWIGSNLRIAAQGNSELYIVSFSCADPHQAATITNAVVEAYFKIQNQEDAVRTQRVIELLEDEKARRAEIVARLRENIRSLQSERSESNPFASALLSDGETMRHPLGQLQSRITQTEVEREILQAKLKAYEESDPQEIDIPAAAIEQAVENHPQVRDLKDLRAGYLVKLDEIEQTSTQGKQHSSYVRIKELLASSDQDLDKLREELRDQVVEGEKRRLAANREKEAKSMKARVDSLVLSERLLRERYFRQLKDVHKSDGQSLDLEFRRTELAREEKVFEMIAARTLKLRAETRAPARVTLLKAATPPRSPANSLPYKKIGAIAAAVFCVPFGLAVLWERIIRRVDDPQQLWQADLTVVGEIARLPVSNSRRTSAAKSKQAARDVSLFEESIDSLRTCLTLSEPHAESRILVISSAVSGEGKTSVAAQLAVSVARSTGETTLLIDADMRSPDIHNVFGIPNEPGLAQVLSRECTLKDAIVTTWSNYVHILPAGVLKASPHKLLGDGSLKALLVELRKTYRHIIIDTSPILSASESLVLAKSADATLLCAMRDVSRVDQVQKAYERLVNTGARPLGTVLNGVPTGRYAYLYGTYAYSREA